LDTAQLNNVSFRVVIDEERHISAFDRLREYFSDRQLILIESAFERSNKNHDEIVNHIEVLNAIKFGSYIYINNDDNEFYLIMFEIMKNIIDHDGEFIP